MFSQLSQEPGRVELTMCYGQCPTDNVLHTIPEVTSDNTIRALR